MSYARLPYQQYDDTSQNQPYPLEYQDAPPYPEDYMQSYDPYAYPVSGAYPPDYRNEPLPPLVRRDSLWSDYPRDYPRGQPIDYSDGTLFPPTHIKANPRYESRVCHGI